MSQFGKMNKNHKILTLFFGVDWYSAGTHNFVGFVYFSKLTHICALFFKEWNTVAKGKCVEQHEVADNKL